MRRSALVVLATVLVGMFLTALPAAAVMSANIAEPSSGQGITDDSPVPVEVVVERLSSDPAVSSVQVQLSRDGSQYSRSTLSCRDACGSSRQTWAGQFDPRPAPIRNGAWNLQLKVNDGGFEDKFTIRLSLPPSRVTNLKASPQERAVQLSWTGAPEPDISGYRIERKTPDGWQEVAKLGPDASSYTHRVPSSGTYSYRVISVRPSGISNGDDLTSSPASTQASVSAPEPQQPPKSPANAGSGAPAPGENADVDSGSSDGAGKAAGPTGRGGDSPEGAPEESGTGPRARRGPLAGSVPPPPPAAGRDFSFNLRSLARAFGFPSSEEAQGDGEGYFGEGEGFSEELDYSGIDPVTGEPVAVPLPNNGLQGRLISPLTNRPLLASLAFGLLFVVLALCILRWIRRSPARAAGRGSTPASSTVPSTGRRRFFRARGMSATPAVRSPTTAPLSPRPPTQARPVKDQDVAGTTNGRQAAGTTNGRQVVGTGNGRQVVGTGNGRLAAAETPERDPTRPSATGPLFAGDAEELWSSRDEARPRASNLFAERRSSATPPSPRDRWGSDTGSETVKVLRPAPSKETGRRVR